jgi:glycosyltransferase involved in cell wall biosynthesis
MIVLFITRNMEPGGSEEVLLRLLRDIDRSRFFPRLFVLDGGGAWLSRVPADVPVYFGAERRRFRRRYDLPLVFANALWAARRTDLVIGSTEGVTTYLAYAVGRLLRRPSLGWFHMDYVGQFKRMGDPGWIEKFFLRGVYRRLSNVIFVSRGARESLVRMLGMNGTPPGWRVIYNAISPPKTSPDSEPAPWTAAAFAAPVILAAGRFVPQKGFDVLLAAFAALRQRGLSLHLVILGDGPDRSELEAATVRLGVADTVWMPGWVANPRFFIRQAEAFLLSSLFEGFGLVLVEALSVGTPVIATDCPSGPREILCDGEFGLLVPPGDAGALADAIAGLLANSDLAESFRERGPARAAAFATEAIIPQWEALLSELAQGVAVLDRTNEEARPSA